MSQTDTIKTHLRNENDKTFCGRTILDYPPYPHTLRMWVTKYYVLDVPREGTRWSNKRYVSCRVCSEHNRDPIIQERVNQMCQVCNQFGRHDQYVCDFGWKYRPPQRSGKGR